MTFLAVVMGLPILSISPVMLFSLDHHTLMQFPHLHLPLMGGSNYTSFSCVLTLHPAFVSLWTSVILLHNPLKFEVRAGQFCFAQNLGCISCILILSCNAQLTICLLDIIFVSDVCHFIEKIPCILQWESI